MLNRFARAGVIAVVAMAGVAAAAPAPVLWRHGVINLKSDAGFVMMPMQHDFAAKRGMRIEAVQVKDGDKTVTYYLKDNGNKEKYHPCTEDKEATVTGKIVEKDGKKWIEDTKVEVKK